MRLVLSLTLAMAVSAPGAADAQAGPQPPPSERRLTPEQIEAVLAAVAAKREAAGEPVVADEQAPSATRPIHGEVGFSIGTGGHRAAFGSATVPLGDEGFADFSFDVDESDRRRLRH